MYKLVINGLIDWVTAEDFHCSHTTIGITYERHEVPDEFKENL